MIKQDLCCPLTQLYLEIERGLVKKNRIFSRAWCEDNCGWLAVSVVVLHIMSLTEAGICFGKDGYAIQHPSHGLRIALYAGFAMTVSVLVLAIFLVCHTVDDQELKVARKALKRDRRESRHSSAQVPPHPSIH